VEILTTRFGPITIAALDRVEFPRGLVGVPQLKRFVLVRDPQLARLFWLQSTRDPAWAFALIEPRAVDSGYQVRTTPEQLAALQVGDAREIEVFVTLNRTAKDTLANLQAPILINRRRSLGVQLVVPDSQYAVRHVVGFSTAMRKSA